jgi:hypothetical protein
MAPKRPSSPTGVVQKAPPHRLADRNVSDDGPGEFEDKWEDDYEEEDVVEDAGEAGVEGDVERKHYGGRLSLFNGFPEKATTS